MKFYKLSLAITLTIIFTSSIFIISGIQYAFKVSEEKNNLYYSRLTYDAIEKHIEKQLTYYGEDFFRQKSFTSIPKDMMILLDSYKRDDYCVSQIESLSKNYGYEYYYVDMENEKPKTNAPNELVELLLAQNKGNFSIQETFVHYKEGFYIGYIKNLYQAEFSNNQRTIMVIAPLDLILDSKDHKVTGYYFENINGNLSSYMNGYITIDNLRYNELILPIFLNKELKLYASFKVDKPEIISELREKTYFIIILVFCSLFMASIAATLFLKKIASQIEKAIKTVDNIANGNYEIDLELQSIYELEQLSKSIHKMTGTIKDKMVELNEKNEEALNIMIEALNETDSYTKGHSDRVASVALMIGRHIEYKDLVQLEKAALLHDIGKITIPEQILNKRGPLTDKEFQIIQEHSETGYKILKKATAFNDIDVLVRHHHEKYDGSGYPLGLCGNEIPLGSQILAIADVYDALTSNRPYRKALSHSEAIRVMTGNMKSHFSPELLDCFIKLSNSNLSSLTITPINESSILNEIA